jgi:hypothetical protein
VLEKLLKNKRKKINIWLFNTQFQRNLQNFCSYLILCKKSINNQTLLKALQNKHKDNFSFLERLNLIKFNNKSTNWNNIYFDNILLSEYWDELYIYLKDFLWEELIEYLINSFLEENVNIRRWIWKHECPRWKEWIFFKKFWNAHPKEILYKFFKIISKSNELYYLEYISKTLYLFEILEEENIDFTYTLEYNWHIDTIISFLWQIFYFSLEDLEIFLYKESKTKNVIDIFNILYEEYIKHIEWTKILNNFPKKTKLQPEIYQRWLMDIEAWLYYHFREYKKNNTFPDKLSLLKVLWNEFYINDNTDSKIIYLLDYENYNKFITLNKEDVDRDWKLKIFKINEQREKRETLKQKIINITEEEIVKQWENIAIKRNTNIMNKLRQFYWYKSQITWEIRINSSIYSLINHDLEVHHIKEKNDIISSWLNFEYDNTPSNLVVITYAEHKLFTQHNAEIEEEIENNTVILKRRLIIEDGRVEKFQEQPDGCFYNETLIPEYRK